MSWINAQSTEMPELFDTTSSAVYNYIRKDVTEEVVENPDGTTTTYYNYLEQKVLKEDWELYREVAVHDSAIADIQEYLIDQEYQSTLAEFDVH